MGDFRLGCVLGMYDKAQSFDVDSAAWGNTSTINSWQPASQSSHYQVTDVHSSAYALQTDVFSRPVGQNLIFRYRYRADNDLYARWSPDVDTHDLVSETSVKQLVAADSGDVALRLWGGPEVVQLLGAYTEYTKITLETVVYSQGVNDAILWVERNVNPSADAPTTFFIDDVITQVDPIILHPGWGMKGGQEQIRGQHRTAGGKLSMYRWAEFGEWEVPLTFLPTSHADLINWWWENQFILAWTLDTSGDTTHLVRIANGTQPIGSREPMDAERWRGSLKLESINDGRMVF